MTLAYDWTSLTVPGAFVLGGIVGFIACARLFRIVLEYLANREKSSKD